MLGRDDNLAARSDCSLREVLAQYAPAVMPLRVESRGNGGGFSGAAIWRVETVTGDFALRRWPQSGLPRVRIEGLHRLLEHVRSEVRCVAVPLRTTNSTTLVSTAGQLWQLEPWLPGVADYHVRPSRERLRSAMELLAQWHLLAERFIPEAAAAVWFFGRSAAVSPAIRERFEIVAAIDAEQLTRVSQSLSGGQSGLVNDSAIRGLARLMFTFFQRGREAITAELRLLREIPFRLQPCLRDVWHDHLLFDGAAVTGLIDPSACRVENVAADLARLIGSLVEDDRTEWDFALAEYQRHRSLSASELALVTVLDRSGVLLSGWTWLKWLCLDRRTFSDTVAVTRRLTEIVRRMERLVSVG